MSDDQEKVKEEYWVDDLGTLKEYETEHLKYNNLRKKK